MDDLLKKFKSKLETTSEPLLKKALEIKIKKLEGEKTVYK
jgi:hypothetical protein